LAISSRYLLGRQSSPIYCPAQISTPVPKNLHSRLSKTKNYCAPVIWRHVACGFLPTDIGRVGGGGEAGMGRMVDQGCLFKGGDEDDSYGDC
jgi:hypothetical protein